MIVNTNCKYNLRLKTIQNSHNITESLKKQKCNDKIDNDIIDDDTEIQIFKENDLITTSELKSYYPAPIFPKKIFLICHGKQLVHPSLLKIKIPNNYNLYFHTTNSESYINQKYDLIDICYNDTQIMQTFIRSFNLPKIKSSDDFQEFACVSCQSQTETNTLTNKIQQVTPELLQNCTWINKHIKDNIIHDCLLSNDGTSQNIIITDYTVGYTSYTIDQPILLSELIVMINNHNNINCISPPYDIFCSFELSPCDDFNSNILDRQKKVQLNMNNLQMTHDIISDSV